MQNIKKIQKHCYERDRSLRSEKLKKNETTITETNNNWNETKHRKQGQISVKSVRKRCQMSMEGRIWGRQKRFESGRGRSTRGWRREWGSWFQSWSDA